MLDAGLVYTRGEIYGDPVWIVQDYGGGLYLAIYDYSYGIRSGSYRVYMNTPKNLEKWVAIDPEDADLFKVKVTLAIARELRLRCEKNSTMKEAVRLWTTF